MKPLRIAVLVLSVVLFADALYSIRHGAMPPFPAETAASSIYFSPGTNLEEVDLSLIDQMQHTIDVAMIALPTDGWPWP